MSYSSKKKNLAKYSHIVFTKQLKLNGESLLEERCTGSCQLGNLVFWSYSWIRDLGRDSQLGHQWDLGVLPQKWYVSLLSFLLIFRQPNLRHFYVFWKFRALLSVFLKEPLGTSLFTHLWLNLGYRSPGHCTLRGFPAFTCSALLFPNVCSMNPKRVPTLSASCKAGGDPGRVCRVGVCRRWAGENAPGGVLLFRVIWAARGMGDAGLNWVSNRRFFHMEKYFYITFVQNFRYFDLSRFLQIYTLLKLDLFCKMI